MIQISGNVVNGQYLKVIYFKHLSTVVLSGIMYLLYKQDVLSGIIVFITDGN